MSQPKRYSPLIMLWDFWNFIKNSFFLIVLYIINYGSESTFFKYGRIAFFVFWGITIISIILKWFTHKYRLDDVSFHIYQGLFNKFERTIPFSKVQNVQRKTSLFHRVFGVTSVTFETGMTGADAAIKFEVISRKEAEEMEAWITSPPAHDLTDDNLDLTEEESIKQEPTRTTHFTPTKKDILKAAFTSLSFIALIPILLSVYFKISEVFKIEDQAEGFFASLMSTWWIIALIVTLLIVASVGFGIVRSFLKYGKYEISSDDQRIYITKGVIDESAFTISKNRVQAIEINQTLMKRLLGLAEIKIISAGSIGVESLETNSLYPFLPVKKAYRMISEILPSYEVTQTMDRLPKKSFWIRMVKPSWFWMIVTVALFYFKPAILEIEQAWWIVSIALLVIIAILRLLDYYNTSYVLNGKFIQFKTGSLTTSVFVSKRDKVVEVNVSRSKFQQLLGLASIGTINHAKPFHHAGVHDIPLDMAVTFYTWYAGRTDEIEIE